MNKTFNLAQRIGEGAFYMVVCAELFYVNCEQQLVQMWVWKNKDSASQKK